jgi:hypothetical protein
MSDKVITAVRALLDELEAEPLRAVKDDNDERVPKYTHGARFRISQRPLGGWSQLRNFLHRETIPEQLLTKIAALPAERIAEVEDFVDFINLRERSASVHEAMALSEPVFAAVWDNPDDAAYDAL